MKAPVQLEIGPGLLVVVYDDGVKGEWVEIASNYNESCPVTPDCQRHAGNVFMPLSLFREMLAKAPKLVAVRLARPFCEARTERGFCNLAFGHYGPHMHLEHTDA